MMRINEDFLDQVGSGHSVDVTALAGRKESYEHTLRIRFFVSVNQQTVKPLGDDDISFNDDYHHELRETERRFRYVLSTSPFIAAYDAEFQVYGHFSDSEMLMVGETPFYYNPTDSEPSRWLTLVVRFDADGLTPRWFGKFLNQLCCCTRDGKACTIAGLTFMRLDEERFYGYEYMPYDQNDADNFPVFATMGRLFCDVAAHPFGEYLRKKKAVSTFVEKYVLRNFNNDSQMKIVKIVHDNSLASLREHAMFLPTRVTLHDVSWDRENIQFGADLNNYKSHDDLDAEGLREALRDFIMNDVKSYTMAWRVGKDAAKVFFIFDSHTLVWEGREYVPIYDSFCMKSMPNAMEMMRCVKMFSIAQPSEERIEEFCDMFGKHHYKYYRDGLVKEIAEHYPFDELQ